MTTWTSYAKAGALAGLIGAVVGGAASLLAPKRYVSTAVIRITLHTDPQHSISGLVRDVLGRQALAEIIQRPSLDLYVGERQRAPLEQAVERMQRDIRIELAETHPAAENSTVTVFRISFAYPEPQKAVAIVRELVIRFAECSDRFPFAKREHLGWSEGENLAVLDWASLPDKPTAPNRLAFVACGFGTGLLLDLFTVLVQI